jgi:hypothetical protein
VCHIADALRILADVRSRELSHGVSSMSPNEPKRT